MNDKALLPCPFCGGQAISIVSTLFFRGQQSYGYCNDCHATGPNRTGHLSAKEAWNQRTPAPDKLVEALQPVMDWYQSDEADERPLADILADIVSDLQADRAVAIKVPRLLKVADRLSVCAQTSGGKAGRDEALVDAIREYSNARAAISTQEKQYD